MDSTPKLHYFDAYARGEPIRLLLSHLKIEWEEVKVDIPPFSPETKEKFEFGRVPMLEMDGMKLVESKAILKYIALKHGLHPTDAVNNYKVNSLVERFIDFEGAFYKGFFAKEEEKAEKMTEFREKEALPTFTAIEKRLKENSSQDYLVGDKLTVADVVWVDFFFSHALNPTLNEEQVAKRMEFLGKFPLLVEYANKRKADFPRFETRKPSPI